MFVLTLYFILWKGKLFNLLLIRIRILKLNVNA